MKENHSIQVQNHSCGRIIQLVNAALDGSLSSSEDAQFLAEIKSCQHCLNKYEIEKSFKSFLKSKMNHRPISPELIKGIKSKINQLNMES